MSYKTKSLAIFALAALAGAFVFPNAVFAQDTVETVAETVAETRESSWYGKPFALEGADVVSFWSADGPVVGEADITATYDNTKWRFSSEENRDTFLEDPEKYIPEFGGYCPVALAANEFKVGSAKHFNMVDETLYVNYNGVSADLFADDTAGFIAGAKANF